MKKTVLSLFAMAFAGTSAFAGGIVTNTNQSAAFVRMPSQDASLGIEAAYHNPAGLTHLSDGFHIQIGNQSFAQTKEIESTYSKLNNKTYTGDIAAPFYPTVYAAYKTGKWAFSLGISPTGGGGGAEYKTGLPSFEIEMSDIPSTLTKLGFKTDAYAADIYFKGTSVFLGFQAGVSYQIDDIFSIYAGARFISAKNTYQGHIRNVNVNTNFTALGFNGDMIPASGVFSTIAPIVADKIGEGKTGASNAIIAFGTDQITLAQAEQFGLPAADRTKLEGGLLSLGVKQAEIDAMTLKQIESAYATGQTDTYNKLMGAAQSTQNAEVDLVQTGTGFAPILGLNINLLEKRLNIGMKYEFKAAIEVENKITKDDVQMFSKFDSNKKNIPNAPVPSDVPAMFSIGASYTITDGFRAAFGYHYYWDKPARYGKTNSEGAYVTNEGLLDKNSYELSAGLEFDVSPKITLSGGWFATTTSPTIAYQTDLSYTQSTNTFAIGARGKITEAFMIDLGFMSTYYTDREKKHGEGSSLEYKDIYRKKLIAAAIGFSYSFGAPKAPSIKNK